jgi:hypothetical protein
LKAGCAEQHCHCQAPHNAPTLFMMSGSHHDKAASLQHAACGGGAAIADQVSLAQPAEAHTAHSFAVMKMPAASAE